MNYLVTLQVKNNFQTVEVKAGSEKEAWTKAVNLGISSIVVKVERKKIVRKSWNEKLRELCSQTNWIAKNRHEFVCEYVSLMTTTKYQRSRVDGYQVKKVGDRYQILWNGKKCGYSLMDAQTAYSWMVRLPLKKFQIEADQYRVEKCS